MKWTDEQIELHCQAAAKLELIKNNAFTHVASTPLVTEWQVQQFILQQFAKEGIVNTIDQPIVGFGNSAAEPHYFPEQKTAKPLLPETLILIDLWGKLNKPHAPYADITWMGYFGQHIDPSLKQKCIDVFKARDAAIHLIQAGLAKHNLPSGALVNQTANNYLIGRGYETEIKHSTGHSLGTQHVHGIHRNINKKNDRDLITNMGYTIEPGIYKVGEYGIRSEMNFYVNTHYELIITTPLQLDLIVIN